MDFRSLGLSPALAQAAQALGATVPTPVQQQALPPALQGQDLCVQAPTGSGKTLAYLLPLLQQWLGRPGGRVRRLRLLVLVPTRELAQQVSGVAAVLAQQLPRAPRVVVAFGGVSINPQLMALRGGADLVIATPGRLLDLVAHNGLHPGEVEHFVLDEADRLLAPGFAEELDRVLALLPARRQTLLFSATLGPAVQALAASRLHAPVHITVAPTPQEAAAPAVRQRVIAVDAPRRTALLRHLIRTEDWRQVLVFVATQHAAQNVAWKLYQSGLYATPFHGGMPQGARTQVLAEFKAGQWDVVVTTDLAARGIDIAQLPVVVNYDLPRSPTDYVHRIGRTGRAGAEGLAVSFVSADTEPHMRLIEKRQGRTVPREQVVGFEPVAPVAPAQAPDRVAAPGTGGIKGRRPSKKDKLRAAAAAAAAAAGEPGPQGPAAD
jgi:ATP-dependent RNA helicase RhlE